MNKLTTLVSSSIQGGHGNGRGGRGRGGKRHDSGERMLSPTIVVSNLGMSRYCPKLSAKNTQSSRFTHVMTNSSTRESKNNQSIIMFENKYGEYK